VIVDALIEQIGRLSVTELKPGDVVVYQCSGYITKDRQADIVRKITAVAPTAKVLVIDGDANLGVLRGNPQPYHESRNNKAPISGYQPKSHSNGNAPTPPPRKP
jgi:hypothetical protein